MEENLGERYIYHFSDFVNPDTGDVWQEGDILKQPQLGKTYRKLTNEPDAIHDGTLTTPFLEDLQALGSIITREDLNSYQYKFYDYLRLKTYMILNFVDRVIENLPWLLCRTAALKHIPYLHLLQELYFLS